MLDKGGVRAFFVGTAATVSRDLVFGGIFACLRHEFRHRQQEHNLEVSNFMIDVSAGCLATIASSPINYVRTVNYANPPGREHIPAKKILRDLWTQAMKRETWFRRFRYIQHTLKVGWGTARVGCGMAFGSFVYTSCVSYISETSK